MVIVAELPPAGRAAQIAPLRRNLRLRWQSGRTRCGPKRESGVPTGLELAHYLEAVPKETDQSLRSHVELGPKASKGTEERRREHFANRRCKRKTASHCGRELCGPFPANRQPQSVP